MRKPAVALHERIDRADEIRASSDRSFGLIFAAVGAALALWPLLDADPPRWWLLAAALALFAVSLAIPRVLRPLNRIWERIGLLLHHIVSPIILAIVYFLVLTPLGLAIRLAGRDPLRRRRDTSASTYWISRQPPGPAPKSMSRQF
jgi:saxitoxin biosynthesis operon SxtJ-like protein